MLLAESVSDILYYGLPILLALLAFRVGVHFIDKSRILAVARRKGWSNIIVRWYPFAPGWFFEKGERHYIVSFNDKDGRSKSANCKTGLLTGVFWRDGI